MTLSEADRLGLWERAGSRCSICKRPLVRNDELAGRGAAAGFEYPIRGSRLTTTDGLVVPARFLDSSDNYILLCVDDSRIVEQRPAEFSPAILARLKASHEHGLSETITDPAPSRSRPSVSLLVHTAIFLPTSPPHYFLKVANETRDSTIQVDRIWFATVPEVVVDNEQRPLPTLLGPGEMYETWKLIQEVPSSPNIQFLARAQLGDGSIVESRANTTVSPAGLVGGGGEPLTALTESVAAINHAGHKLIEKEWDVFISHATEDKMDVVRPLAHALRKRGLRVWYDEFELRLGDSLRRKIDQGIARSTFGVVVLSPAFFAKGWTNYELDGLVTRSVNGEQIILPLWHRITHSDVMEFSPSLADRVARDIETNGVEKVADEIRQVVLDATASR